MTIKKTLAQLLAEDPDLEYRLKQEGKWHKVTPAWAMGSVPLSTDGILSPDTRRLLADKEKDR